MVNFKGLLEALAIYASDEELEEAISRLQNVLDEKSDNTVEIPSEKIEDIANKVKDLTCERYITVKAEIEVEVVMHVEDEEVSWDISDVPDENQIWGMLNDNNPDLSSEIYNTQCQWESVAREVAELAEEYDVDESSIWELIDDTINW